MRGFLWNCCLLSLFLSLLLGQASSTGCGGSLRSLSGSIQSVNYPNNYPNNVDCVYVIRVPEDYYITLSFEAFDLEKRHDYLQVRDGGSETSPTLGHFTDALVPPPVSTSGNQMWIKFHTDVSTTRPGFSATYNAEQQCQTRKLWGLSGVVQSPNYPSDYPNGANCAYVITVAEDYFITLTFTALDMQVGQDYVEIRDGGRADSPLLGIFSDASLPLVVQSSANQMWIRLVTDASVTKSGFSATYTGRCGGIWTAATGTIQSPDFPLWYPNNQNCLYIIRLPPGQRVTLTFTSFTLEGGHYDYVQVHDGESEASPSLGKFSGSRLPPSLTSSGNNMSVHFVSDRRYNRRGFRATYTSGP